MTRRPRWWRGVVIAWAVLVVVGGGLTWWLQDSTEPPGPVGQEGESSPMPGLPEGWETLCPSPTPDPDGGKQLWACAFISG